MVTATPSLSFPGSSRSFAPLGVGTWAWGDKSTWGMGGYDTEISEATIAEAFDLLYHGIRTRARITRRTLTGPAAADELVQAARSRG